jgi:IS1 family transposase
MMVGIRTGRCELDELWAFVGKKQKNTRRHETEKGDQYTFIALASSAKAIIAYHTGKRDSATTDEFVQDLRGRVIGLPEISTNGFHPYKNAIRDAFGNRVAHGVVQKTYSVTDLRKDAAHRGCWPKTPVTAAVMAATTGRKIFRTNSACPMVWRVWACPSHSSTRWTFFQRPCMRPQPESQERYNGSLL